MGIGVKKSVEIPAGPTPQWAWKKGCKSMEQDENDRNYKKTHAGRGQETKWETSQKWSDGLKIVLALTRFYGMFFKNKHDI